MSENASYNGQSVKIGTCEEMYYLRADQAHKVRPEPGNVDPVRDAGMLRFRFPLPSEDHIEPGAFEGVIRGVYFPYTDPEQDHGNVQFQARGGYLVSLPCPEGKDAGSLRFMRNGHPGPTKLVSQRWKDGRLMVVLQCAACEHQWRLETLDDCLPLLKECDERIAYREHEARISPHGPESFASEIRYWREIRKRIVEGYTEPARWAPGLTKE